MSDRITDIIIGDHVELMAENRRLQEEFELMREDRDNLLSANETYRAEIERLSIDLKMSDAMYRLTVKQRDFERVTCDLLRAELRRQADITGIIFDRDTVDFARGSE